MGQTMNNDLESQKLRKNFSNGEEKEMNALNTHYLLGKLEMFPGERGLVNAFFYLVATSANLVRHLALCNHRGPANL